METTTQQMEQKGTSRLKGLHPQHLTSFAKIRSLVQENININEEVDDDGNSLLQAAILHNCCKGIIKYLVSHGANLQHTNQSGATALILCCRHKKLVALKTLVHLSPVELEKNQMVDNLGNSALHYACRYGCVKMVSALLSKNASVTLKNNEGNTVLHEACFNTNQDVCKIVNTLLEQGSCANVQNNNRELPLHIACKEQENTSVVSILIKATNDIEAMDDQSQTCLHHAALNEHVDANDIMALLIKEGMDGTLLDSDGQSAFLKGLMFDADKILRFLVKAGKHLQSPTRYLWERRPATNFARLFKLIETDTSLLPATTQDRRGNTLLHYINNYGMGSDLKHFLLNTLDSDLDIKNNEGVTPMHIVAEKDVNDVFDDFLDIGGEVTAVDDQGNVPFVIALQNNNKRCIYASIIEQSHEIVSFLDVNPVLIPRVLAPNHKGYNLLHFACRYRCSELVHFLADKGDVNQMSKEKNSPLHMTSKTLKDYRRFSTRQSPNHNSRTSQATKEIMQVLIDNGADMLAENQEGLTPLAVAFLAANGDAFGKMLNLACEKNMNNFFGQMDINDKNYTGDTPLVLACIIGCSSEVIQVLLQMGAKCDLSMTFKVRPVQFAGDHMNIKLVELLLSAGDNFPDRRTFSVQMPVITNAKGEQQPVSSTTLHLIAEENDHAALTYLMQSNVPLPINELKNGKTVLHTAIHKKTLIHPLTVASLLMYGADVHAVNQENSSALESFLLQFGQDGFFPHHNLNRYYINIYQMAALRLLISAGSTIDVTKFTKREVHQITPTSLKGIDRFEFVLCLRLLGLQLSVLNDSLVQCLSRFFRRPISLRQCCAVVIRTNLKPNAWVGVEKLILPKALKSYVICQYKIESPKSTDIKIEI